MESLIEIKGKEERKKQRQNDIDFLVPSEEEWAELVSLQDLLYLHIDYIGMCLSWNLGGQGTA